MTVPPVSPPTSPRAASTGAWALAYASRRRHRRSGAMRRLARDSATAQTPATARRPGQPVHFRGPVPEDRAGEVVELDRDRRRVDLGERQVVLGPLAAEEGRGDSFELEPAELRAQLGTAQLDVAQLDDDGTPGAVGRDGHRPTTPVHRALHPPAPGPGGQVAELDEASRTSSRTGRRASPRPSPA